MVIGILKDIKKGENRVIATPGEVATLIGDGNTVKVQKAASRRNLREWLKTKIKTVKISCSCNTY